MVPMRPSVSTCRDAVVALISDVEVALGVEGKPRAG
jgi:hypothetical protein